MKKAFREDYFSDFENAFDFPKVQGLCVIFCHKGAFVILCALTSEVFKIYFLFIVTS